MPSFSSPYLHIVFSVRSFSWAGFSTVYLVRDTRTREHLALKRMLCQERDSTEAAHREVQVLRAVAHRNVVSLLDQVRFVHLS